jgi:hypothetical protein
LLEYLPLDPRFEGSNTGKGDKRPGHASLRRGQLSWRSLVARFYGMKKNPSMYEGDTSKSKIHIFRQFLLLLLDDFIERTAREICWTNQELSSVDGS